jgi:hypothetical protein
LATSAIHPEGWGVVSEETWVNRSIAIFHLVSSDHAESSTSELEILRLRDELIGVRAEDAERKFRFLLLKQDYRDLGKKFDEQTLLLRENMTRAYVAEKRVLELQAELDQLRLECDAMITAMKSSRSWKLARTLSSPIRLFKRLLRP